jgi:hypothetical protein
LTPKRMKDFKKNIAEFAAEEIYLALTIPLK